MPNLARVPKKNHAPQTGGIGIYWGWERVCKTKNCKEMHKA